MANKMRFKTWFEGTDIFGFDALRDDQNQQSEEFLGKPIRQFDLELMMELLSRKSVGIEHPHQKFMNEIQWGNQPGAVKLEVDTGFTFYIKKLGKDMQGNPRWATKRMFQLNRSGYGGLEDVVAQEVHPQILRIYNSPLDAPLAEYEDLENLVTHIANKIKRCGKDIFLYQGIKKLSENAYIIAFELRGHGLETQDQRRIEQNHTMVAFDPEQGTIRITNFNIESDVGRNRSWQLMENDLDIYFFPSQDREEISECLAVHMKYY